MANADSAGVRLRNPTCRHIRRRPFQFAQSISLWQLLALNEENLCATCGGPTVKNACAYAHFVAAADVWAARSPGARTGTWQYAALSRLLAATTADRWRAANPTSPSSAWPSRFSPWTRPVPKAGTHTTRSGLCRR